jgi:hypothetical protein
MADLNNRQMVLLTMLTSFVVSIATGIMTVAMLQSAPQTLTQTVNRVVERTIERVVTGTSTPVHYAPATTVTNVTKEVTVYAKEDDLAIAAVEKNQGRIAQIYRSNAATSSASLAIGFVVSRDGLIVTESKKLFGDGEAAEIYIVAILDKRYVAKPLSGQKEGGAPVYFLKLSNAPNEILDAVSFGQHGDPKLAQTVVLLGGNDGQSIFKTTLSKFEYTKVDPFATGTPPIVGSVHTSPKIPEDNLGALVVNLDAQVVGIVIPGSEAVKYVIYPSSRILELLGGATKEEGMAGEEPTPEIANQALTVKAVGN